MRALKVKLNIIKVIKIIRVISERNYDVIIIIGKHKFCIESAPKKKLHT